LRKNSHIEKLIKAEIGEIVKNQSYQFVSDGNWSMHQLLEYLLEITGPAHVVLSTFSIGEVSIRSLYNLKQAGSILSLKCLFDKGLPKRKLSLLYFANNVFDYAALYANHSKILVIINDQWSVAVNASANFTPNFRIEAGVITTKPNEVSYYNYKLSEYIEKGIPLKL
jgi:hypothetical protein